MYFAEKKHDKKKKKRKKMKKGLKLKKKQKKKLDKGIGESIDKVKMFNLVFTSGKRWTHGQREKRKRMEDQVPQGRKGSKEKVPRRKE